MRRVSRRHATALRVYATRRVAFLEANPNCARCGQWAFQVHHKAGRLGSLLLDESNWLPLCGFCHDHVTRHPQEAIAEGWSLPRVGAG